ncbi:MAG: HAD family hydrolase [Anaerolineales bacterium]|nr:HAD family hydrolase [Anaerolineales bacterium]
MNKSFKAENPIKAVIFDMGGTLEELYYDETIRQEATQGLHNFLRGLDLDPGLSLPDLQFTVLYGIAAYQSWREQSEKELSPEKVWTEYIFTNHGVDKERLMVAAEELAQFYETHYHTRSLRPEAPAALEALHKRGFRLAIISNVISRQLVSKRLVEYGIAHYFDPVVTSSNLGWRKPNTRIFEEAASLLRLPPKVCAYVGDTITRDVIGARRAGYGLVIQIKSFLTDKVDLGGASTPPDAVIHDLRQVIDLVTSQSEADNDN